MSCKRNPRRRSPRLRPPTERERQQLARWHSIPFGRKDDKPLPFRIPEAFILTKTIDQFLALTDDQKKRYMKAHALWLIGENAGERARTAMEKSDYDDILTTALGVKNVSTAERKLMEMYLEMSVLLGQRTKETTLSDVPGSGDAAYTRSGRTTRSGEKATRPREEDSS